VPSGNSDGRSRTICPCWIVPNNAAIRMPPPHPINDYILSKSREQSQIKQLHRPPPLTSALFPGPKRMTASDF
jgi:hypothetical protein